MLDANIDFNDRNLVKLHFSATPCLVSGVAVMRTIRFSVLSLSACVVSKGMFHHRAPLKNANYFGVFFDQAPNFAQIEFGTQNPSLRPRLNKIFTMDSNDYGNLEGHCLADSN